jgi:hypothetical protein
MRSLLPASALALVICAYAHADIGPKPRQFGPGVQPTADLDDLQVEMSAEEVELILAQRDGSDTLTVRATFHMTNHADTVQRLEIGFPVGPILNMSGFQALQGCKVVETKLIDRAQGGQELTPAQARAANSGRGDQTRHDYWYVWDAVFPPGQSDHVVEYTLSVWHFSEYRSCGYLLHTGAPWKNAIGKAVVRLRCEGDLTLDHVTRLSPRQGGEHHGDEVVWTFTDLEPTQAHDIGIQYNSQRSFGEELAAHRERGEVHFSSKCELVWDLQRAPERRLREAHTDGELSDYLTALQDLIGEVEFAGDKLILPLEEPANVHYPDDMPPEVVAMLRERTGNETRQYARKGEVHTLLRFYAQVVDVAQAHPGHAQARSTLRSWTNLVERFLAGRLFADTQPLAYTGPDEAKQTAALEAQLARARALLVG